jgi:hypothetical protein
MEMIMRLICCVLFALLACLATGCAAPPEGGDTDLCTNGFHDETEVGIDCGGECTPCPDVEEDNSCAHSDECPDALLCVGVCEGQECARECLEPAASSCGELVCGDESVCSERIDAKGDEFVRIVHCEPRTLPGERCGRSRDRCTAGHFCGDGVCRPTLAEGDSCDDLSPEPTQCGAAAACLRGTCQAAAAIGEPCFRGDCAPAATCFDGVCAPKRGDGQSCAWADDCAEGTMCDFDEQPAVCVIAADDDDDLDKLRSGGNCPEAKTVEECAACCDDGNRAFTAVRGASYCNCS